MLFCCAGDKCRWITDVQCNVQTEAESVQPRGCRYHFVQENDGFVTHHVTPFISYHHTLLQPFIEQPVNVDFYDILQVVHTTPSVLRHCRLGDRKGIWLVKIWCVGLLVVMI